MIGGWFQGRFELGPRALGNRSIIVDPSNEVSIRKLSNQIKKRAKRKRTQRTKKKRFFF